MIAPTDALDPPMWIFDVLTASHDDVKAGRYDQHRTRVVLSRQAYPCDRYAAEVAACMAVTRTGGMPTRILPVY